MISSISSGGSYGAGAANFSQMKEKMQASLAKLKETDPQLASKMEQIGTKMEAAAKN